MRIRSDLPEHATMKHVDGDGVVGRFWRRAEILGEKRERDDRRLAAGGFWSALRARICPPAIRSPLAKATTDFAGHFVATAANQPTPSAPYRRRDIVSPLRTA
uniref:Uncharacterized protein n=1 Tax=Plectus sambesii TaxID=2011161 RepID=A0A914VAJ7_9BILA